MFSSDARGKGRGGSKLANCWRGGGGEERSQQTARDVAAEPSGVEHSLLCAGW